MVENYAVLQKYSALKRTLEDWDILHQIQKQIELKRLLRLWVD